MTSYYKYLKTRFLLFALAISTMTLPATAYDFMAGNLYYNINDDGTSVTVTYPDYSLRPSYISLMSGNLTIPNSAAYNGTTYSVTTIGSGAFNGCSGLTNVTIPNSVTTIGPAAFEDCSGLTNVTIPNSVSLIRNGAFAYSGLTSVTIPNSITTINGYTFQGCSALTNVDIPNSVTTIRYNAFDSCCSLKNVIIPSSVIWIDREVFQGCSSLKNVTIPNSVKTISAAAFSGCTSLTSIHSLIENPVNVSMGNDVFLDVNKLSCKLYVPRGSVDLYHEANQWKDFEHILPIDDSGDVNGDNVVSGADVTALYNVLLDGATADGDGDVNGDGVVSGADVTALYNLLLGQ